MASLFLLLLVSLSLTKALPTSEVVIKPRDYAEPHQRHRRSSPPVILPDLVVNPEINEGAYYQGDMILTEEQKMERNTRKLTPNFITWRKWPTDINYSLDEITTEKKKMAIRAGIAHWEEHTCLRFTEQAVSPYLKFVVKSGCWSFVGKVSSISQEISIGSGCDSLGVVSHEIGHAMGFEHEQARSDRDAYVEVVSENIASGKANNFDEENTDNRNLPYDYSSNMHYAFASFSKNGFPTLLPKQNPLANVFMGSRDGLRFYDIKLANLAYDCIEEWKDSCGFSSDPCLNEGFIGSDCQCVCRPGTSGTNCENNDMEYYDALVQKEGSGIRTSVITTEGQLISDAGSEVQKHSYLIRAPECHNVVLSVTELSMHPRSSTSSASNICHHEYLNIRKDLTSTEISAHCDEELSSSSPSFTSVGREMVLDTKLLTTWPSKWKADVSFSNNCNPTEISLESSKTGDCLFVKEGSDYFYRNPSYPATDSPGFECSLSFTPSDVAYYTLSVVSPKAKGVSIKYWKPKNLFVKIDQRGAPVTLATSGGKLQVKSTIPKKNAKDIMFNIKIEPKPAYKGVKLIEGKEEVFVYNSEPGTENAEYRFEAPEGKRVRIKFTEFNVGNAEDKKCKNSNYVLVGKSEDFFYTSMLKYCDDFKSANSKKIVSVGNVLSLYVERKYDVEDSFVAKVKAVD